MLTSYTGTDIRQDEENNFLKFCFQSAKVQLQNWLSLQKASEGFGWRF